MAITIHSISNVDGDGAKHYEFQGKSTDPKPTEWGGSAFEVNSLFMEEDTGDFYYFDDDDTWKKYGGE